MRPLDNSVLRLKSKFEELITANLKELLEKKHLYQSISVDYAGLLADLSKYDATMRGLLERDFLQLVETDWMVIDKADHRPGLAGPPCIRFETPDVKLFCSTCNRIEAFNSISSTEFSQRGRFSEPSILAGKTVQVFVFSLLCQSCKVVPEVFLVRRHGLKLTNSGRSPIEHVEVHPAVPKSLHKWFRSAIVAYQSGQTLAGIFLLRTLIEQWVREITQQPDLQADRVLEAYMGLLPPGFKARFPSLSSLYGDLSDDLHRAIGSSDLFESVEADIIKHFEARRVFDL